MRRKVVSVPVLLLVLVAVAPAAASAADRTPQPPAAPAADKRVDRTPQPPAPDKRVDRTPQPPQPSAVALLSLALDEQLRANTILGDPTLNANVPATREAVLRAAPHILLARQALSAALPLVTGQTRTFVLSAIDEIDRGLGLGLVILFGRDEFVPVRLEELRVHGGVALSSINLALLTLGAGPSAPGAGRLLTPSQLTLPPGYRVEIVANRLNFASVVEVAASGEVYVAEAGFSYGNVRTPPRVLRVGQDGSTQVVATGFEGPIAGLAVDGNDLFVSHRGTVTRIDLRTGARADIITGLPSLGDHFNENLAIGPDGKLYVTQGTATNSGIVGPDNYFFGWLQQFPTFHDFPCRNLTLLGRNYLSGNPLTRDPTDFATTGAFLPFGTPSTPGQVVPGTVKCNGAVLRANRDGSGLEVFADGFRNPYGLAFHPDGRLFVTENGPDDRGSRPVAGPDNFYEVVQGGWYGWPDFYGGVPINDPSRKPETHPIQEPVLLNPPPLARLPFAQLERHSASNGFDFSSSPDFAPVGQAFIAQFGDLTPPTAGGLVEPAGRKIVTVSPTGQVSNFLTSATDPALAVFRPTDATFDPSGRVLYVTHFGDVRAVPGGILPAVATGALLRIVRTG
jgi:glucose/arabinose dehydrogenase